MALFFKLIKNQHPFSTLYSIYANIYLTPKLVIGPTGGVWENRVGPKGPVPDKLAPQALECPIFPLYRSLFTGAVKQNNSPETGYDCYSQNNGSNVDRYVVNYDIWWTCDIHYRVYGHALWQTKGLKNHLLMTFGL